MRQMTVDFAEGKGGHALEYGVVFLVGSLGYGTLEILWRGYTHWSMLLTGGICFGMLYGWHSRHPKASILQSCLFSGLLITGIELAVGLVVNCWLKLNVWDYSRFRIHFLGQICLVYSLLWCLLGLPIRFLCHKMKRLLQR